MVQFMRPDGVVSQGNWTGAATAIDEATADDADYVYSQNNPNGSIFEVSLSNPSTPGSGTCTCRYRTAISDDDATPIAPQSGGTAVAIDVGVYQGASLIQADAQRTPSASWVQYSFTFNTSAVSDWNDLRIRMTASGGGGSPANRRGAAVSWAELEIPDASTVTLIAQARQRFRGVFSRVFGRVNRSAHHVPA